MIELRTLGTLELRGTDGQEFRRIIQQPKRLALLAYLAAATPRRFHRRDALLALFWPDLDTEHARGSLRRSLYFLRRILGDDVIVGRGDEEVGLAPDALWCDTVAFDEGLKEDAPAALDLYRGDFLQGFYISGAPEFERWLDRERARLLELAATTAWRVADDAIASHPTAAARRARWAAALTPYDDEAHRRLIALLVRVGDRAGAMRVHDDFVRRLRADYEVAPSSEMQALVQTLTTTSTPPVAAAIPAEPARRPPASPNVVAVLPFTVRGSRELAYLSEGMVDLLSTTLDGAGDLRAVDARALLAHLAHGEDRPLDPERGRAAARALGAGRYVLGGIVLAGARIRITATLYDHSAAPTRTAEVTGNTEAGIFDMVDDLGRQLLGGEGSGPGARMANLAARTTESLSALKAYLRGEADFRAGRYFQALESFQNAAAEDTGFALAWYRLAAAAAATADLALAREASAQASQNRDRLGAHDRILLDAQRAWLRGAADEAERLYAAALATHVDDIEAWFALGDVLFHHNPLRGRSMIESRDPFERALRYDPEHVSSIVHLARLAAFDGRLDDLDSLVDRVLRLSPAGDRALSMRALRAFALRNEVEKARTVTALGRARALAVGIAFTDILLYARDFAGSHRLARIVTKLTRSSEGKALCHMALALLNQTRGRFAKAQVELKQVAAIDAPWAIELRTLFLFHPQRTPSRSEVESIRDALERWDPAGSPPNHNQVLSSHNGIHPILRSYLLGITNAKLGALDAAAARAAELEEIRDTVHAPGFATHLGRSVRAQIACASGDTAEALRILGEVQPDVWYQLALTSPFYAGVLDRFLRAELLFGMDRCDEALGWYGSMGQSSPYELIFLAPAQLRMSEIHARRGRQEQAAEHAAQVVKLWDGGDAEVSASVAEAERVVRG